MGDIKNNQLLWWTGPSYGSTLKPQVSIWGPNSLAKLTPFEFQTGPQFPRIVCSFFSGVSHPNFSNLQHHNLLSLLYSLVGGTLMMTKSSTRVWDPLTQELKWPFGSIALFLPIKLVIRNGTLPSDIGRIA